MHLQQMISMLRALAVHHLACPRIPLADQHLLRRHRPPKILIADGRDEPDDDGGVGAGLEQRVNEGLQGI